MKTILRLIIVALCCVVATDAQESRGLKIEAPIEGLLLAGKKDGLKITGGVVFLGDDGSIFSADTATISEDRKSMIFKGKPLFVSGNKRMFSKKVGAWVRITKDRGLTTSHDHWRMDILPRNK